MNHRYILGLGSNVGDRYVNLANTIIELKGIASIIKISPIYSTKSLLNDNQTDYYNIVLLAESELDAEYFFDELKQIEQWLGRVDNGRWQERLIDIDIIDYNGTEYNSDRLTIPHVDICNRSFVLYPLRDILPDFKDVKTGATIDEMIALIKDDLQIKKI